MRSSFLKSLVLTSLTVVSMLACSACGSEAEQSGSSSMVAESVTNVSAVSDSAEAGDGIAFPYEVDGGKLLFKSVFPSDINNPDMGNEYKDGLASIEFENQSDEYLRSAMFYVTMADGSVRTFKATDIPAGAKDWAFETGNQTVELQQAVEDISYDTSYGAYENSVLDQLSVKTENLMIHITNNSGEELFNLNVLCHADMGDALFGGIAYTYNIEYLGVGETVSVDASECLLGVKVVDVVKE